MFHYICRDLINSLEYLPFGIFAGAVCFLMLSAWSRKRRESQKEALPVAAWTMFFTYLAMMLMITFWSRESGSRRGLDLELFSTWGINRRNNAYVIENVLLFVPYGILCPMAFRYAEKFRRCLTVGALTSVSIELLQLATGRGFFQIDDILTNALGTAAGYLVYLPCSRIWNKMKKRGSAG